MRRKRPRDTGRPYCPTVSLAVLALSLSRSLARGCRASNHNPLGHACARCDRAHANILHRRCVLLQAQLKPSWRAKARRHADSWRGAAANGARRGEFTRGEGHQERWRELHPERSPTSREIVSCQNSTPGACVNINGGQIQKLPRCTCPRAVFYWSRLYRPCAIGLLCMGTCV